MHHYVSAKMCRDLERSGVADTMQTVFGSDLQTLKVLVMVAHLVY